MARRSAATQVQSAPPLVCTADDALLDVLLDWCSALGAVPEVARDPGMAKRGWREAALVLVGDDLVGQIARDAPPRRRGVFVVARPGQPAPWDHAMALGAEDVVGTAGGEAVLAELTAAIDGTGEACVVAVVGAVGGAGASCLASTLALEVGRRGLRVLLVDGDPLGGGLDVLLGIENRDGLRWPDVGPQSRTLTARSLADALPRAGNVSVLAAGRRGSAGGTPTAAGVLGAARRGFDVVVCDVNRHLVDQLGSELLAHALLTVVVVPEDVRSLAAAATVVERVGTHASSIGVVTVRRRPGLHRSTVAETLGVPVLGRLRPDRRLQLSIDHGVGPGESAALRRAVRPLVKIVGGR